MARNKLLSNYSVTKYADKVDSRFLWVTIDILHTGENLNGSYFTKEVVDRNIESLKNTPILGFVENGDFKGHEREISESINGYGITVIKDKYLGRAYGVIPETCNPRWVVKYSGGEEREYLQVDAVMWTKLDGTDILINDMSKAQSMELDFNFYEGYFNEDDNLFYYTDFKFDGCCILGNSHRPAMVGSNISVKFSKDELSEEVLTELNNKFNTFTALVSADFKEGGSDNMEKGNVGNVGNVSADVRAGDTVANNVTNDASKVNANTSLGEIGNAGTDNANTESMGDLNSLDNANADSISVGSEGLKEIESDEDKKESDEDAKKEDEKTSDETVNEEPKEEESTNLDSAKVDEMINMTNQLIEKYNELEKSFNEMKPEYDRLVAEEEARKAEALESEKNNLISKFEVALGENEKFIEIKEKKSDMTVEEMNNKFAILYAEKSLGEFSAKKNEVESVDVLEDSQDNPNVIKTKYGNISVKKRRY